MRSKKLFSCAFSTFRWILAKGLFAFFTLVFQIMRKRGDFVGKLKLKIEKNILESKHIKEMRTNG
ncbi:hypothetical protein EGW35_01175 [Enterococcus durans]|nr:hypothetical protein CUM72_05025 [Enterococcus durans]ROX85205.1 hypothetical protein EGW35_01175 [Enterococcus durans]TKN18780.1 hypothetical protein DVW83_05135 [Enterococcus sp. VV15]